MTDETRQTPAATLSHQKRLSNLGLRYLRAIDDWKAPFEVAALLDRSAVERVSATLLVFVARGLAEHHRGNNTFRITLAGREQLTAYQRPEGS